MDSSSADPSKVNEPFTKAERMQQLGEIDHDIISLLEWTGKAIQSLAKPESQPHDAAEASTVNPVPDPDPAEQTEAFKTAMNAFLSALHSVDVRLKRQIMSLEEAGIINLKASDRRDQVEKDVTKSATQASLEPNGIGNIGNLDVGWLNSRSSKVERDMEVELWERARTHLETLSREGFSGEAVGGDMMQE